LFFLYTLQLLVFLLRINTAIVLCSLAIIASLPLTIHAQTIWGVGDVAGGATLNKLYSVNAATGAATRVCATTTFTFESAAIGVSNLQNGLVYYVERNVANPRVASFDPTTCTNGTPVSTALPTTVVRATACPDGRFYVMNSTAPSTFYEINPTTGAILRSLTLPGIPSGSSGDFSCISNGDMYLLSDQSLDNNYELYKIASPAFQLVPNLSAVASNLVGTSLGLTGAPNGLTEAPTGTVGCAVSPNPCLVASTGATNQTWGINTLSGIATNAGATNATLADLSRNFPIQVATTKSVTPTTALQGQTVTYTVRVGNPGTSVIGRATVTDTLSPAFGTASWICSVVSPGSTATLVTTACGVGSGSGNINNTVSLSIGGTIEYVIIGVLAPAFTGNITNFAGVTTSVNYFSPAPLNNAATVTSTVSPATNLSVTKTNGTTTVAAGSTTSYTVTFINSGPGAADNAVARDFADIGLSSCIVVSCIGSGTPLSAVCPSITANLLSPAGVAIPAFPANSNVVFQVHCGVTATGI
jgi:uncharacterized repeat protein (TIGR01451 family)